MTGQEAIELIHQRAWTGRKPGLERTQALLASLGNPERRLRFVHITGTNGKGSTAAMTASILAQAGLRAGLFTSPHLYRFHERMQVNGAPIPDEVLGRLTQRVLEVAEGMSDPPTEFELMTAVGMEFFLEEQCDIVVLEVGLGGGHHQHRPGAHPGAGRHPHSHRPGEVRHPQAGLPGRPLPSER